MGGERYGGGIYNDRAEVTLTNCYIEQNSAEFGGGIYTLGGRVTLRGCSVLFNSASNSGGGIANAGRLFVENRTGVDFNFAPDGVGGGIWNMSQATEMSVTRSTVNFNRAQDGAGIYNNSDAEIGQTTVTRSLVLRNVATRDGGGIYNNKRMRITNTTIDQNHAQRNGAGVFEAAGSQTQQVSLTITDNVAQQQGGGVYLAAGAMQTMANTVVAYNQAAQSPDVAGMVGSYGNNFVGNGAGASGLIMPSDRVGTAQAPLDPLLSPLGYYGGDGQARIPLPGSPLIDTGGNWIADGSFDQRGLARIVNGTVDIGAAERQASEPDASASVGNRVWLDADADGVQDAGEAGVEGIVVQLLDANGLVVASAVTDANGDYQFTNLAAGTYRLRLVLPQEYAFTAANQGGDDGADSDVDPLTWDTAQFTLTALESNQTLDAGLVLAV